MATNVIDTKELIGQVADEAAEAVFVEAYRTPETLEFRKLEGLGIRIAQWTRWDGLAIMKIFRAALEDANFHGEAAEVEAWIAKERAA